MRIKRIHINNFRCLGDANILFDDVTSFIGPNGAGKSTILRALDWFFNGTKSNQLTDDDCTYGSESTEISVEVEFFDINDRDREELGSYVTEGSDTFIAWKYKLSDGSEKMTANSMSYEPFNSVRSAGSATAIKDAYRAMKAETGLNELPNAGSADAVKDAMKSWELEHTDQLTASPAELTTNFFGFNSQAKMSGLFDFVLVTADLRASEEVMDNKGSIIGKILEKAVDREAADTEIAGLSDDVNNRQREIYDRHFSGQLENIGNELTAMVGQYTDSRTVHVASENIDIKPPKTQFSISIGDQDMKTDISRQGHGFQRTLLISSLQLLAKKGVAGTSAGTICLAIEEPELFQHPVQARAFSTILRQLAEDRSQGFQVAYATHSPYFITAGKFDQVRRLSRKPSTLPGQAPNVIITSSSIVDVISDLDGIHSESMIRQQLDSVALHRLPEALFANNVVLVEGTTDRAILEGITEQESETPLSVLGTVVVDVSGKPNLFLPYSVLKSLGINTYVIFDSDIGVSTRMAAKGKTPAQITQAENDLKRQNRELLTYLGQSPVDWPAGTCQVTYAVVEDTLEPMVRNTWPEWSNEVQSMIDSGIGNPEKNSILYKDVTKAAGGTVPAALRSIVDAISTMS